MESFLGNHLAGLSYALGSNFAVVISAMLIYILLLEGRPQGNARHAPLIIGVSFGIFSIISMLGPIHVRPGVIIDAKYPLTAIATIYGGPIAGIITATIAAITRGILGGMGAYAAFPTLLAAWGAGIAFRKISRIQRNSLQRLRDFLLLGCILWVLQLLGGFIFLCFLPWSEAKSLIIDRSIPALVIFPPMTVLLGLALDFIESRNQAVKDRLQTLERLEVRNRELQALNYVLHHDLRTPVVTLQGFLSELEEDLQNADLKQSLADLERTKEAAARLGKLLYGLGKLKEASGLIVDGEHCDAEASILAATQRHREEAEKHGLHFETNTEPLTIPISGPSLAWLLDALIHNAIRFSAGKHAGKIEVGCSKNKDGYLFWIQDQGIGIEPEYQTKVFALFEKLDARTAGMGIGLTLAKRIVETHRGKIWVESAGKGQGSKFSFLIPE